MNKSIKCYNILTYKMYDLTRHIVYFELLELNLYNKLIITEHVISKRYDLSMYKYTLVAHVYTTILFFKSLSLI